jgi:hypothetical protein
MVYVAAELARSAGNNATNADRLSDELAEVRWIDLAEADELMGNISGNVRQYLARMLGG